MDLLNIVKIGGNVIDNEPKLEEFIADFAGLNGKKILIHGGGKIATELSRKLGIETKMKNGRRITDSKTLDVAIMVYAGLLNKRITAALNSYHSNALGICGADMNLIPSVKRKVIDIDYGMVGDVNAQNLPAMKWIQLLDKNITPVVAPITADAAGQLLNTNADTIASSLAKALAPYFKTNLVYCFEKKGVLSDPENDNSVIPAINKKYYTDLKTQQIISGGMIPKLDNAFDAIDHGVHSVIIGESGMIKNLTDTNNGKGTLLTS